MNVIRVNVDISAKMKEELVNYKDKHFNGSTSSWLGNLLEGYLHSGGLNARLTPELITRFESMGDIAYNGLGFYLSPELCEGLDELCKRNMRNRKQQLAHFIYSIYSTFCVLK